MKPAAEPNEAAEARFTAGDSDRGADNVRGILRLCELSLRKFSLFPCGQT